ncbi:MAG: glycosyltransferase [Desulfobacula sp.]|nr:glycosyltransferase [Desulfobacula sp.]
MQENITPNNFTNKHPKVAIIILNWNGKEDTIECLESLEHITYSNYEILLVDNGSTDGSAECFRERYPGMEIIENGENLGFAEGNNVGIYNYIETRGIKI